MSELLTAFGIDAKLIIVQILNFVVLAGLLSYLLYKPILKILAEREAKIASGIKDAEEAAQARAEASKERSAVLQAAHQEAEDVHARAKVHAEQEATTIVARADEKATLLVRNAEAAGEQLKAKALKESEEEVARLAILGAERILKEKA